MQEQEELISPDISSEPESKFSIIGIGASAGGLEALKLFFDHVPSNFLHSFVIVQHLSPAHKSLMKELLEKNTSLPIFEVKHEMHLAPRSVYLIPPGKNMILKDRALLLSNKPESGELNMPINIFFDSLAQEEKSNAIAVLLSGTGSDGTKGAQRIHELGGVVVAQSSEESKFNGMPISAIQTGVVNYVTSAAKMPGIIARFVNEQRKTTIERELDRKPQLLEKLLHHVETITLFNFGYFKKPTLIRRIAKRISLGGFQGFENYFSHVLEHKKESLLLKSEFLISVTEFYRDTEVWSYLKGKIVPAIIKKKKKGDTLKFWSVGCSTGQEAYSLADMVSQELLLQRHTTLHVKIFASDASQENINFASKGYYSKSAVKNLSQAQIGRMFDKIDGKYLIKDHLRQMVVFSAHNVLVDPPFGKMDLVMCRNLLIYMNKEARANIIGTLQYSLNIGGIMVLGKSESIGVHKDSFQELNSKNRVFKNLKVSKSLYAQKVSLEGTRYNPTVNHAVGPSSNTFAKYELIEVLNKCLPQILDLSFLLIDQHFKIAEAVGNFSKYLQLPQQGFSTDLFDLVPEHMRAPLNVGFNRAIQTGEKVKVEGLKTLSDDAKLITDILIFPKAALTDEPNNKHLLVFMPREQKETEAHVIKGLMESTKGEHITHLETELKDARHALVRLQHELEIRNEELQTSNEELLATNEELQSTNEELQSVNEELYTVNAELNQKVHDLAEANAHINNILKSSNVNTLFLDSGLNIRKFTPGILEHYNISIEDAGRPLSAFTHNFGTIGDNLLENSKEVMKRGVPFQKEMKDLKGRWFLKRISPFYDAKNSITGVVITFVNITGLKVAEQALRDSEKEYKELFDNAPDMFVAVNENGHITNCNNEVLRKLGYDTLNDVIGKHLLDIHHVTDVEKFKKDFEEVKTKGYLKDVLYLLIKKSGGKFPVRVNAKALFHEDGSLKTIYGSWRDVSRLLKMEHQIKDKNMAFEQVIENTMAGFWDWNIPENTEYLSPSFKKMFGYEDHEMESSPESWQKIIHPDDLDGVYEVFDKHVKSKGKIPYDNEVRYYHKNGSIVWVWCKGKVIEWDKDDNPVRMVGSHIDITALKNYEKELRQSNHQLERFAYVASHDLQEPLRTITDFTGLLQEEYQEVLDDNAEVYMDYIIQASNRMGQLVKSILAYSKIGNKGSFEMCDLNAIVKDVKNDLLLRIKESNATIRLPDFPMVWGNAVELHSLFLNLLGNALKFIDKDRIPQINISIKHLSHKVEVSVMDNGIGIAQENQEKIFDVFKRLHNLDEYEGTGIGLAHCKKIVALHGGKLWLTSDLGKGSSFHFTLHTKPIKHVA